MSLRLKLVIGLASLAALASIVIGASSYRTTEQQMESEVDASIDSALTTIENVVTPLIRRAGGRPLTSALLRDRPRAFDRIVVQVLDAEGEVLIAAGLEPLPVDDLDRSVASSAPGESEQAWREIDVDGEPFRIVTQPLLRGGAVQVARSLAEMETILATIRQRTIVTVAAVIALAALTGWLIARQVTRRLVALTAVSEQVAQTGRFDVEPPGPGRDEVGRLSAAFAAMLDSLHRSREAQTRLAQDAGHELRTPLTSLRTNISLLRRHPSLDPEVRAEVLADLEAEALELSSLVEELVTLAAAEKPDEAEVEVSLRTLAEIVAERAERRSGRAVTVEVGPEPAVVVGRRAALERALGNLVENALKFSASPAEVSIVLEGSRVEVRDRGPGLSAVDRARIFERFYRGAEARSHPGSGLGLAIVREIVESHGGSVFAEPRDGGGSVIGFEMPR